MDKWKYSFNFEGGCYAKVINLSEENEPDILEQFAYPRKRCFQREQTEVDFEDVSITQNTRVILLIILTTFNQDL
jgi:phosphoenolpyruvate carboxykinase (ATP)